MRERLTRWGSVVAIVALLAVAAAGLLTGGGPTPERSYRLEKQLRCPVCKTVSIAESPSQTAQAMRSTVEEQIRAGRTDQQILDYFTARYGDWVLMAPPARGRGLVVWLLPLAAAALGALVLTARRRPAQPEVELTAEEDVQVRAAIASWNGPPDRLDRL